MSLSSVPIIAFLHVSYESKLVLHLPKGSLYCNKAQSYSVTTDSLFVCYLPHQIYCVALVNFLAMSDNPASLNNANPNDAVTQAPSGGRGKHPREEERPNGDAQISTTPHPEDETMEQSSSSSKDASSSERAAKLPKLGNEPTSLLPTMVRSCFYVYRCIRSYMPC